MSLHSIIAGYRDTILSQPKSEEHMCQLVAEWGMSAIIHEVEDILANGSSTEIEETLFFVKDLSLKIWENETYCRVVEEFRTLVPNSNIFSLLAQILQSKNRRLREASLYTLGKMSFFENASLLRAVIPKYITQYPEELDLLLSELFWLEQGVDFLLIEELVALHKPKVSRAIILYLETHIFSENSAEKQRIDAIIPLLHADVAWIQENN